MGNSFFDMVTTIALAIVTVGIVAVVVSKNAQTPAVIQSAGSAFGNSLAVAEAPVTGAATNISLSYPGGGLGFGSGAVGSIGPLG